MGTGTLKKVSVSLLVAFLATVLSPHFPWESVASDAHHALSDVHEGELHAAAHGDQLPGHDHHDEHACAGHQFGHLPFQVVPLTLPLLACVEEGYSPLLLTAVPSGVLEAPLRPPRTPSFA
jgi:hypothetical protein